MCDLVVRVVGRKASCTRPTLLLAGWLVEDHVWWLLVGLRGDSMHWADGAAAEKRQILFGKLMISLLYDDDRR